MCFVLSADVAATEPPTLADDRTANLTNDQEQTTLVAVSNLVYQYFCTVIMAAGGQIGIGLFSLAARSWINTMNITKYKKGKDKLGLISIVECQYQRKITDCT